MRYYTVKTGDTISQIALQFGITVTDLKRKNKLLNNILRVGQQLEIPATPPKDIPTNKKTTENLTENLQEPDTQSPNIEDFPIQNTYTQPKNTPKTYPHRIAIGESWYSIAQMYHTTVSELKKLNPLLNRDLRVGGDMKILAENYEKLYPEHNLVPHQHIVVRGDTLHIIAQKYNVGVEDLKKWNNLVTGLLDIGQVLDIISPSHNTLPKNTLLTPKEEISLLTHESSPTTLKEEISPTIPHEEIEDNPLPTHRPIIPKKENQNKEANTPNTKKKETPKAEIGEGLDENEKNDNTNENDNAEEFLKNTDFRQENISHQTAKLIFRVENQGVFIDALQSPVGIYHVSKADDIDKIQKKLVEKGFLPAEHEETPEKIYEKYGKTPLTANFLPNTWEALQEYQDQIDLPFWQTYFNKVSPKERLNFAWGIIKPNDLTHKLLKEGDKLTLSFPHPHTGKRLKWILSNYLAQEESVFPQNYYTKGQSKPDIPMSVWQRLGLTLPLAEIMDALVQELGNFDTFIAHEKDLKYGALPFKNHEILDFVRYTAQKSPALFQECFGQFGFQMDEKQKISVQDDQFVYSESQFLEKLRSTPVFMAIFGRTGFYLPMITLQLDFLLQNYIFPSLGLDAKVKTQGQNYILDLVDVLANAEGLKFLFRKTLKDGLEKTQADFQNALQKIATTRQLYTPAYWHEVKVQDIIWQMGE